MPLTIANVSFCISSAVDGPEVSLGGAVGAEILGQTATQPVVISGVYIAQAIGNPLGVGALSYSPSTQTIGWKPKGLADTYMSQPITANGTYVVGNYTVGQLVLSVTIASLPTIYKTEAITIDTAMHTVFGPVTTTMSLLGSEQYHCLYFKNKHPSLTASDLRLYIHSSPSLPQVMEIGVDPAGVGDGVSTGVAQTIANVTTAPVGVTFSSPILPGNGLLLGAVGPNQMVPFWQKRIVPAGAYGPLVISRTTIGVALVG